MVASGTAVLSTRRGPNRTQSGGGRSSPPISGATWRRPVLWNRQVGACSVSGRTTTQTPLLRSSPKRSGEGHLRGWRREQRCHHDPARAVVVGQSVAAATCAHESGGNRATGPAGPQGIGGGTPREPRQGG